MRLMRWSSTPGLLDQGPAPFPVLAERLSVWLEGSSALDQAA